MPVVQRDDVVIHYEEHGTGFPVLALAPGGMHSTASFWEKVPWSPVRELAGDYRVITMDQRNAGSSTAPVTGAETWATYTADHLAVLDHLGIERCHVVGMCIGGPFILSLLRAAPDRVARAVVLQPIGLDGNRDGFLEMFDNWRGELEPTHPEAGQDAWAAYRAALFGGDDVLFSVPDAELSTIGTPMLVLQGNDRPHPSSASRLLASSVPGAQLVERWKEPEHLPAATEAIAGFLAG
ncbi:MAG: alpha/beta hydrolase [Pseudonocardia sp.]|nr:alpha/beta hydrolase [Pseudonocardia sp.]